MSIEIKVEDLLAAFDVNELGLDKNGFFVQSDCFAIKDGYVYSYNDRVGTRTYIEEFQNLTCVVEAGKILKLLNKTNHEYVKIQEQDSKLKLTFGEDEQTVQIPKNNNIEMPIQEFECPFDNYSTRDIPENFLEILKTCDMATSNDNARPNISSVHIKENISEATDRGQAVYVQLDDSYEEMLIPSDDVKTLTKFQPVKYTVTDVWLYFFNEFEDIIALRKFEPDFPDVGAVVENFDKENAKTITVPDEISDVLERTNIFNNITEGVSLKISENKIKVSSSSFDDYSYVETVETSEGSDDEIEFDINSNFIENAISLSNTVEVSDKMLRCEKQLENVKITYIAALMDK